jgi:hypothetical protein
MPTSFRSKSLAGKIPLGDKVALLIPRLKICLLQSKYCLHWTPRQPFAGGAVARSALCWAGGRNCDNITWQWRRPLFDLDLYTEQLALLKTDLRVALDQVEAHEAEVTSIAEEVSRAFVEALEEELTEALEEVRRRKQELQPERHD